MKKIFKLLIIPIMLCLCVSCMTQLLEADKYFKSGLAKYQSKDFQGAEKDLEMALKIKPDFKDAALLLREVKLCIKEEVEKEKMLKLIKRLEEKDKEFKKSKKTKK